MHEATCNRRSRTPNKLARQLRQAGQRTTLAFWENEESFTIDLGNFVFEQYEALRPMIIGAARLKGVEVRLVK